MLSGLKKKFYSSKTVERQFGKYSGFTRDVIDAFSERSALLAKMCINTDIKSLLDTSDLDIEIFRDKKLVQISTWNTTCGIAAYCKALREGLEELGVLSKNDVLPIDSNFVHHASYSENEKLYDDIADKTAGYDIVVVQYEFWFFTSDKYIFPKPIELFCNFIKKLRLQNPKSKILIYMHNTLNILDFINTIEFFNFSKMFAEIANLGSIYFIVNTQNMITDWYGCGIKAGLGIDPVKNFYKDNLFVKEDLKKEIAEKLSLKENDKVLMMLGFINQWKRYDEMAEILALLPENYKFLAAGGVFPDCSQKIFRKFKKKIKELNLEKRVYITGLFDDEDLGTYFDIADIMCAPYAEVRIGSGSIPMLFLSEKPVIAYETDMINLVNSQTDFRPVISVEYDNRNLFKDKILEVIDDKNLYLKAQDEIKGYSSLMNNKKLAELVLKVLSK